MQIYLARSAANQPIANHLMLVQKPLESGQKSVSNAKDDAREVRHAARADRRSGIELQPTTAVPV
jgi:hypothetical protein